MNAFIVWGLDFRRGPGLCRDLDGAAPGRKLRHAADDGPCAPTSSTTGFAVEVNGKILKLDSEGNKKAAEAFKAYNSGAERAKEPNSQYSQVTATVNGTMKGNQIKVDSIEVH